MSIEFILPVRVYVDDTDAGKIVYHANYLKYFEHARTEWLRSLGVDRPAVLGEDRLLVIAGVNVEYLMPAKLDDLLHVTVTLAKIARSYMIFSQLVKRAEDVICRGEIKVACVKREGMKPATLPDHIAEQIKQWAAGV